MELSAVPYVEVFDELSRVVGNSVLNDVARVGGNVYDILVLRMENSSSYPFVAVDDMGCLQLIFHRPYQQLALELFGRIAGGVGGQHIVGIGLAPLHVGHTEIFD